MVLGKAHGLCTYCFTVTAKDMQLASQDKTCPINGNVKRFTGAYEVEFENGKRQNFSYIIYATGNLIKLNTRVCTLFYVAIIIMTSFTDKVINIHIHIWMKILEFMLRTIKWNHCLSKF